MNFDLPDETSTLYRYVRRLDRRLTKLRHKAVARQPATGLKRRFLVFLLGIPILVTVISLLHRIENYVKAHHH